MNRIAPALSCPRAPARRTLTARRLASCAFKVIATVKDTRLDEYKLFVVVNGGLPTAMSNSSESYPHKEAVVDISSLPAQADGSVDLNFVAKDLGGKVIATKALKVSLKP